jgi:hypothetical protein
VHAIQVSQLSSSFSNHHKHSASCSQQFHDFSFATATVFFQHIINPASNELGDQHSVHAQYDYDANLFQCVLPDVEQFEDSVAQSLNAEGSALALQITFSLNGQDNVINSTTGTLSSNFQLKPHPPNSS